MKWGTGLERYFALLKILEIGSFTKAADAMGYSQSAVSQMVQSLESELSLKLLYRSRNGIKLTPEGEALLPYIQRTVNHYNAMLEKTRELKGLNGGLIRIGTLSSVSSQWLPGLIKDFQTLYPKVHFLLHQGDYTTIPAWVRAGRSTSASSTRTRRVSAACTPFLSPAEGTRPFSTPTTLWPPSRGSPWSSWPRRPSCCWRGCLSEPLEAFRTLGLEPRVELRMHDNFSICSMVEANVGVSILPELALRKMNFRIVQLPTVPPVIRRVSLVMKDPDILPIASRYFIEFFLKRADTLP